MLRELLTSLAQSVSHPRAMREPPLLDHALRTRAPAPRHALLVNPFYRKDPHASFGKHVLTPTLALTSVAAATPPEWTVRYWDENLLQGPPPVDLFPSVVGITARGCASGPPSSATWTRAR